MTTTYATANEAYEDYGYEAENFDEAFSGEWDTEQAYAENLVDECGMLAEMPENLRYYFDYEAFARDLFIDDYFSVSTGRGTIYVFNNHV